MEVGWIDGEGPLGRPRFAAAGVCPCLFGPSAPIARNATSHNVPCSAVSPSSTPEGATPQLPPSGGFLCGDAVSFWSRLSLPPASRIPAALCQSGQARAAPGYNARGGHLRYVPAATQRLQPSRYPRPGPEPGSAYRRRLEGPPQIGLVAACAVRLAPGEHCIGYLWG